MLRYIGTVSALHSQMPLPTFLPITLAWLSIMCGWCTYESNPSWSTLDLLRIRHWNHLQVPVRTPAEAEEMFDVISYRKGACIIRMLYDWIGAEVSIYCSHLQQNYQQFILIHTFSSFFIRAFVEDFAIISMSFLTEMQQQVSCTCAYNHHEMYL